MPRITLLVRALGAPRSSPAVPKVGDITEARACR
jgi:hypothetical protein